MGYTKEQFLVSAEHAIARERLYKVCEEGTLLKACPRIEKVSRTDAGVSVTDKSAQDGSVTVTDTDSKVEVRGRFDDTLKDWLWEVAKV